MQIVALHGQLGMASDWDGLAGKLAGVGYEVNAVDLWSYLADGEVGMGEFGKRLNADHGDGQILLGYSMGGRLALHALMAEPEKWRAAVIVSAHSGLVEGERMARRLVDDEWGEKVGSLPWAEFLDQWNGQGVLGNDVMPDRSELEGRRGEIARSFKCWGLAEQEVLLHRVMDIKIPILFVVGERDKKFCSLWDMFNCGMGDAVVLNVPDAGHRVPWEAEDALMEGILSWMKTVL